MNRCLLSNFKNRPRHKLQNIASLKLIIFILIALWPAAAWANSGSDNDPTRKNTAHDVNRSAPQNVQPAQPTRSFNRDMTSKPSAPPSRTFSSPQPGFMAPSVPAGGRGTIQFRSNTQPPSFSQPATSRRIEVPKFELTADAPNRPIILRTIPTSAPTPISVPYARISASESKETRKAPARRAEGKPIKAPVPAALPGIQSLRPPQAQRLLRYLRAAAIISARRTPSGVCRTADKSSKHPAQSDR